MADAPGSGPGGNIFSRGGSSPLLGNPRSELTGTPRNSMEFRGVLCFGSHQWSPIPTCTVPDIVPVFRQHFSGSRRAMMPARNVRRSSSDNAAARRLACCRTMTRRRATGARPSAPFPASPVDLPGKGGMTRGAITFHRSGIEWRISSIRMRDPGRLWHEVELHTAVCKSVRPCE